MAKKVKSLFKKLGKTYMEGFEMLYGPVIRAGISPMI